MSWATNTWLVPMLFKSDVTALARPLSEVDAWYEEDILPQRTVGAGTPSTWLAYYRLLTGNVPSPNGICGDAAAYVRQEYPKYFNSELTSDGYRMGGVLWFVGEDVDDHTNLDYTHASVIMMEDTIMGSKLRNFTFDPATGVINAHESGGPSFVEIMDWHVYDLFMASKVVTLETWWSNARTWASDSKTTIQIGLYAAI